MRESLLFRWLQCRRRPQKCPALEILRPPAVGSWWRSLRDRKLLGSGFDSTDLFWGEMLALDLARLGLWASRLALTAFGFGRRARWALFLPFCGMSYSIGKNGWMELIYMYGVFLLDDAHIDRGRVGESVCVASNSSEDGILLGM